MHEISLCESMRELIEEQAQIHGETRIARVRLEIGSFAGVEKQALIFAFDVVMRGSVADGAKLEIIDLPGRAKCIDCNAEVDLEERLSPCPLCRGFQLVVTGGTEIRIKDLETA